MNAATARAIEQLKEARETIFRAIDDPTLTADQRKVLLTAYYDTHNVSLTLSLASSRPHAY